MKTQVWAALLAVLVIGCESRIEPEPVSTPNVPSSPTGELTGKVTRIVDGDTLVMRTPELGEFKIRLEGIDAPETDQRFGAEATKWLTERALGRVIRVDVTGRDFWKRRLGHIYDERDTWLNKAMIQEGLAWHYLRYNKDVRLAEAQHEAQSSVLGLWQDAKRITPWDFRNGQRIPTALPQNLPSSKETDQKVYVTETGRKYHRETCHHVDTDKHYEMPISRVVSGYEPCKVCRP